MIMGDIDKRCYMRIYLLDCVLYAHLEKKVITLINLHI